MMIRRNIPPSGESLPVIGLGTWKTFDVENSNAYPQLTKVLDTLYQNGGRLIDSSPMYGRSEQVIGDIATTMTAGDDFFYATKVWTTGLQQGIDQMENSMKLMKRKTIDLMQIHNLLDLETHLPQLRNWKDSGKIKYIGITHYTDSSHDDLVKIIKAEKPDFVQFNYSIFSRNAEKKLFPVAADLGVATIVNRPFGEGSLFNKVKGKSLPGWATEFGIDTWAAFFLKFIIANPAVTCVIPATANPQHALDNANAGKGELPDGIMRQKMIDYLDA
jgi:diketogulonate reductase-like aldo/keto reductase